MVTVLVRFLVTWTSAARRTAGLWPEQSGAETDQASDLAAGFGAFLIALLLANTGSARKDNHSGPRPQTLEASCRRTFREAHQLAISPWRPSTKRCLDIEVQRGPREISWTNAKATPNVEIVRRAHALDFRLDFLGPTDRNERGRRANKLDEWGQRLSQVEAHRGKHTQVWMGEDIDPYVSGVRQQLGMNDQRDGLIHGAGDGEPHRLECDLPVAITIDDIWPAGMSLSDDVAQLVEVVPAA